MRKNQQKIIVLNITSGCNLDCEFCFGPECGEGEPTNRKARNIIKQAASDGAEKLVFTGGEPLLRDDIFSLIKQAKEIGLATVLHTNGLLFSPSILDKLRGALDQINLPLDGHSELSNDSMRSQGHFQKVIAALKLLKDEKIKVVVSSVATLQNKDDIVRIGEILKDLAMKKQARIDKWRVFQFKPAGKAIAAKEKFYLSSADFSKITREIEEQKYPFSVQRVTDSDSKFHQSYYII